jgi:hypothetical protein
MALGMPVSVQIKSAALLESRLSTRCQGSLKRDRAKGFSTRNGGAAALRKQ